MDRHVKSSRSLSCLVEWRNTS